MLFEKIQSSYDSFSKINQFLELVLECDINKTTRSILEKHCKIKYILPFLSAYVIEINPDCLPSLSRIPFIQKIHFSTPLSSQMYQSKKTVHLNNAQKEAYTGEGIGIAILDTGISPVEDFCSPINRIAAFQDFIKGKKFPYDDNGHGTHVSGIACGNGMASHGKYAGIAPKSHIISIKILDENGQGSSAQALAGIQWIMDNKEKYNIRIANLSIGTNDRNINVPLARAVNAAWDNGITIVAAAGNTDGRYNTSISHGISKKIITVGSYQDMTNANNYKSTGYFSYHNYLRWADVLAPGKDIISCLSPDYSFRSKTRNASNIVDEHYVKMSGTSMATPMVSGAIALLIEKYPAITPDEIKKRLKKSSAAISQNKQVEGLLNIEQLLLGG